MEGVDFVFDETLNLVVGGKYYIVISSPESSVTEAYSWQRSPSVSGIYSWKSTNNGTTWTPSIYDRRFTTYTGDAGWNETYDVNLDNLIDEDDLELVNISANPPSYDGTLWTPLVDFNAEFGTYEKILDKSLGFDAYLGKILSCGLPTYTISCGDGRCSSDYENYSSCSADCIECNNDRFCANTEASNCSDCSLPPAIPRYFKFNGSTTDFENVDDIGNVSGAILEVVPLDRKSVV